MKKIIHHIRKQPEEVKRHILHILVAVGAVILVVIWIYSLGTALANPNTQTKISGDLKPFSVLKTNIINGYNSLNQ